MSQLVALYSRCGRVGSVVANLLPAASMVSCLQPSLCARWLWPVGTSADCRRPWFLCGRTIAVNSRFSTRNIAAIGLARAILPITANRNIVC
jgi:hypothetical protein